MATIIFPAKKESQKLVLPIKDLRTRTTALFEKLSEDEKARNKFIKNPAEAISQMWGVKLPKQEISDANRFLFCVLANDKMNKWLSSYDGYPGGKRVTDAQFARDFSDAITKYGDADLVHAALQQSAHGFGLGGSTWIAIGPGQVLTSDTASATDVRSSQNFQVSSQYNQNTTTAGKPGDMAKWRALLSQLAAHAKLLKQQGSLRG